MEFAAEAKDCRQEPWSEPDADEVVRKYAISSAPFYTWHRELLSVQTAIITCSTPRFADTETKLRRGIWPLNLLIRKAPQRLRRVPMG